MPAFGLPVPLALARAVDVVPEGPAWMLEPKWDGWRCLMHTTTRRVWSRHGTDLSRAFSDVGAAAAPLPDAVLDGELVAVLADGSGVAFESILVRLEAITDQWAQEGGDQLFQHIEDARQLAGVLRLCIEKDVPLGFL